MKGAKSQNNKLLKNCVKIFNINELNCSGIYASDSD
jgi:hypothetical protein